MKKVNWAKINLNPRDVRGGKAFCPFCHKDRKPQNRNDRSLSVDIQAGIYNCHNCGTNGHVIEYDGPAADGFQKKKKEFVVPKKELQKISDGARKWFEEERGLTNYTLLKFKIGEGKEWIPYHGREVHAIHFPYLRDGKLVNIKYRSRDKQFKMISKAELILFNIDSLEKEKTAILVEGEIDAMTVDQCKLHNVVSVPNGASRGSMNLEYLDNSYEKIKHIEKWIIAVDDDEAGRALSAELIKRFGPDRCFTIAYPAGYKDLNEVYHGCKEKNLPPLGEEYVVRIINNAQPLPIAGVYYALDVSGNMIESFRNGKVKGTSTHCPEFDILFKWKLGNINLITDYPNSGKTTFWLQMMLIKSIYDGWKWAVFCPENYPAEDFFDDLAEMYVGKHVDDSRGNKMTEIEYVAAIEFLQEHFFYIYPEEGHDLDAIHAIVSRLNLKHGVNGVLIDPWNELDHNMMSFPREDLYLSASLKKIKRFALVNEMCYNIIAHPVKKDIVNDGKTPRPEIGAYDVSGGSMWWNKTDNIICHSRPNWHMDRSSGMVKIKTEKIKRKRTGGSLGDCEFMFNPKTMRYAEATPPNKVPCDPLRALRYHEILEMDRQAQEVQQFIQGTLPIDPPPAGRTPDAPSEWRPVDPDDGDMPF